MADQSSGITRAVLSASTFVEKSAEFKYFLLFSSLVLLLDSCLVLFFRKNIFQSFVEFPAPELSVGGAVIFLALFSFLMAVFFRALRHILMFPSAYIYFRYLDSGDAPQSSSKDYSYSSLAERDALIEKDEFVYARIQDHKSERNSIEAHLNIGFGMCVLFLYNFLVLGDEEVHTLSQVLAFFLDADNGFWVNRFVNAVMGAYVLLVLFVLPLSLKPYDDGKVYLPKRDPEAQPEEA